MRSLENCAAATTSILIARGDEIRSHTLIERGEVSPEIEILRDRAVMDPLWLGTRMSSDGKTGAHLFHLEGDRLESVCDGFGNLRVSTCAVR